MDGNGSEMDITYVIYLIDDIGEEFFINQKDELVGVKMAFNQNPLIVKNLFQISAQLNRLRKKYVLRWQLFALEYDEFLERKDQLSLHYRLVIRGYQISRINI
ncbi:hypothetical protein IC229_22145 [Spirosoma sp. BT702]|uniref:Uncharacterized protein n=1 Tax=Spirosoma profusum TaxID=2771354 RepID=A0A927AS63_9BACT|nr:hypothetical protein [Spirosoma profusum]MBD2703361.1 hypothetical protein [Spirosoma profusum]